MQAEMQERKSGWAPVEIKLKFETKSELAAFLLLHNDWSMLQDVLNEQIDKNPEYHKFDPDKVELNDIVPYELWQQLNVTLEE